MSDRNTTKTTIPETDTKTVPASQKPSRGKRIAALVCVVLLVSLYVFTLIAACLDFPSSGRLFQACLVATIGVPILLWIYIWLYGRITNKHTMTD